jgi:hypothetical protein
MRLRLPGTVRFLWIAVLALAAWPVAAQEPARFRPQPGTRYVEFFSSASVHGVRNGDTVQLRAVRGNHALQEWSWVPGDPPRLRVRSESIGDGGGGVGDVTLTVAPNGALRVIGSRAVASTSQDFPIFPADGLLEPGRTWTDSLSVQGTEGAESYHTRSNLTYRVSRVIDTLGTRVAVIDADGREVRRFKGQPGSALWPASSVDVAGPARHTWWFDLRAGRLLELRQQQDLRGSVTFARPPRMFEDVDTASGGMRSTALWREVSPGRAALLRRIVSLRRRAYSHVPGLGGSHGTHQVRLAGDTVESLLMYGDRVKTARTVFREGRVVSHAWEQTLGVIADGGELAAPGHAREGALPLSPSAPATAWAVAMPGMEEHLVPALMSLRLDSTRRQRFAVYRPIKAYWTSGSVQMVPLEWRWNGRVLPITGVVFRDDDGQVTMLLAFDRDRDVILARTREGGRWRRRSLGHKEHLAEWAEKQLKAIAKR